MTRNILITSCLSIILLTSCKKDNITLSKSDYMIFGHFYGRCKGEQCIEIFKLQQDKLSEDTTDQYPNREIFYEGAYVQLSKEKYNETKDLPNYFPTDLLYEKENVIGQPDAGDWGGLYIEYNFKGMRKYWLLDKMKSNVPVKYHNFIDKLNEKITLLQ